MLNAAKDQVYFHYQINKYSQNHLERRQNFLVYGLIEQCEGKDANNYTYIQLYDEDSMCSPESIDFDGLNRDTLTVCDSKMRVVNQMKTLAISIYPQGGIPFNS